MKLHAHIVMDVYGDTRHTFNPESEVEVREAMKRFDEFEDTHCCAPASRRPERACALVQPSP